MIKGMLLVVAAVLLSAGCATTGENLAAQSEVDVLLDRIDELERTSGRWQARVDGLEEEILLLDDRVESHRLSLERRGVMPARSNDELPRYRAPSAEPDHHYMAELPVRRLSPDDDERPRTVPQPAEPLQELVITNETLAAFVAEHGDARPGSASNDEPRRDTAHGSRSQTQAEPVQRDAVELPTVRLTPSDGRDPAENQTQNSLDLYQSSLSLFNQGSYAAAESGFLEFINTEPAEDYLDNAHYWIGECHYASGEYELALVSFQTVVSGFPDGNKVPDSLLKIGLTFEQLNDRNEASEVLHELVETYPLTDAARRASERLAQLN